MPAAGLAANTGLRSRKLDQKKLLPIVRYDGDDNDLENPSAARSMPAVATGVEKEEEEEHHLQAALIGIQTDTQVVIPTPDASKIVPQDVYDALYASSFVPPKSLIRFSTAIDDVRGCPYNIDETDDVWLDAQNAKSDQSSPSISPDAFEYVMAILEAIGNDKVSGECPSIDDCLAFISRPDIAAVNVVPESGVRAIYEHWRLRRYGSPSNPGVGPLIPRMKFEDMSANPESDPYVCFRRREIKQLRKARRTDTSALEKLRRLREDLLRAKEILDAVSQREIVARECIHLDHLIFERRISVRRLKRQLGLSPTERDSELTPESRRKKSRRGLISGSLLGMPGYLGMDGSDIAEVPESTKIRIPMQKLRDAANLVSDIDSKLFVEHYGPIASSVEEKIRKIRLADEKGGWADVTEDPYLGIDADALDFWQSLSLTATEYDNHAANHFEMAMRWTSRIRRRVGRGGRIVFDRRLSRSGRRCLAPVLAKWHFDASDDEDDFDLDIDLDANHSTESDEDFRMFTHRAFTIAPRDEEYRILTGKPAYPEQVYPTIVAGGLNFGSATLSCMPPPPPNLHVIRTQAELQAVMDSSANGSYAAGATAGLPVGQSASASSLAAGSANKKKARSASVGDPKQATAQNQLGAQKKKQPASQQIPEQLDTRSAVVKAIMMQAQRQAQQVQVQAQMQQQSAGASAMSPSIGSSQNPALLPPGQVQQTSPDASQPGPLGSPAGGGVQQPQTTQSAAAAIQAVTDALAQASGGLPATSLGLSLPTNLAGSASPLAGNIGGVLANQQLQQQLRLNQMRLLQQQQALLLQQQQQQHQQQNSLLSNLQLQLQIKALQQQQQQQQLAQSLITAQNSNSNAASPSGTSTNAPASANNVSDGLAAAAASLGLGAQMPPSLAALGGTTNAQQQLQQLYLAQQYRQQLQQQMQQQDPARAQLTASGLANSLASNPALANIISQNGQPQAQMQGLSPSQQLQQIQQLLQLQQQQQLDLAPSAALNQLGLSGDQQLQQLQQMTQMQQLQQQLQRQQLQQQLSKTGSPAALGTNELADAAPNKANGSSAITSPNLNEANAISPSTAANSQEVSQET